MNLKKQLVTRHFFKLSIFSLYLYRADRIWSRSPTIALYALIPTTAKPSKPGGSIRWRYEYPYPGHRYRSAFTVAFFWTRRGAWTGTRTRWSSSCPTTRPSCSRARSSGRFLVFSRVCLSVFTACPICFHIVMLSLWILHGWFICLGTG